MHGLLSLVVFYEISIGVRSGSTSLLKSMDMRSYIGNISLDRWTI